MFLAMFIGCLFMILASAQSGYTETVYSAVVFTLYGDRNPYLADGDTVLTPLGAQQLYSAGSTFRDRYVIPSSPQAINNISALEIDGSETFVMSTADGYIVTSAQAFMQGLYPPLDISTNHTVINSMSVLANGSNIDFPLGGYQYPTIYTTSSLDPNSIWIAGEVNCPAYMSSAADYLYTADFTYTEENSMSFYQSLYSPILEGVLSNSSVGYGNAYPIFDYVNFGYIHNDTIRSNLNDSDLEQVRALASQYVYAINGNLTNGHFREQIQAVAGRTFASEVVGLLMNNIATLGASSKINLLFGSFEPFLSFAALAKLSDINSYFNQLPQPGSSMVFELFGVGDDINTYPDMDQLYVRFLFRNGTDDSSALISYPLFGNSPSQVDMSLEDFTSGMDSFTLGSVEDWCNTCGSLSIFCAGYANSGSIRWGTNSSFDNSNSGKMNMMQPAVAGVIGAVAALAVAGIAFALMMLLGGVRMTRSRSKRRSELGGFKGAEKLASDPDLTVVKGSSGATVLNKDHQRLGSWELSEGHKAKAMDIGEGPQTHSARHPSYQANDDISEHQIPDPVKADERV
ncbi:MAG: hypothetical protein M1834_007599 [Cirrosporium novae-zelandiae]|nr:MAG: hypothetical protein M1834_007599 [Cirrosporium novae-zelandiae]